jgi:hypothetical protein
LPKTGAPLFRFNRVTGNQDRHCSVCVGRGQAAAFAANLDLSTLDGTTGFKLSGEASGDLSGWSVASAGDVNGDGIADMIIDANRILTAFSRGASYVVFGQTSGFSADLVPRLRIRAHSLRAQGNQCLLSESRRTS